MSDGTVSGVEQLGVEVEGRVQLLEVGGDRGHHDSAAGLGVGELETLSQK